MTTEEAVQLINERLDQIADSITPIHPSEYDIEPVTGHMITSLTDLLVGTNKALMGISRTLEDIATAINARG